MNKEQIKTLLEQQLELLCKESKVVRTGEELEAITNAIIKLTEAISLNR